MLATVEVDGDRLSDDELGMFLIQLLVAGNETTRHSISGAVVALAEHPEQWDRPRPTGRSCADRGRGGAAVDDPGDLVPPDGHRRHDPRRQRRRRR